MRSATSALMMVMKEKAARKKYCWRNAKKIRRMI